MHRDSRESNPGARRSKSTSTGSCNPKRARSCPFNLHQLGYRRITLLPTENRCLQTRSRFYSRYFAAGVQVHSALLESVAARIRCRLDLGKSKYFERMLKISLFFNYLDEWVSEARRGRSPGVEFCAREVKKWRVVRNVSVGSATSALR